MKVNIQWYSANESNTVFEQMDPSADLEGLVGQVKRGVGRKRDGATFPLEVSLSKGYHGKVLFYVAIMRDITDKLEAEARLKVC